MSNVDIKEVLEFSRDGRQVLRVTGIYDCEELICWEVMDNSQGLIHTLKERSNSKLSTFRWPFFAYTLSS